MDGPALGAAERAAHASTAQYILHASIEGALILGSKCWTAFGQRKVLWVGSEGQAWEDIESMLSSMHNVHRLADVRALELDRSGVIVAQLVAVVTVNVGARRLLLQDGCGNALWAWSFARGISQSSGRMSVLDMERDLSSSGQTLDSLEGLWMCCEISKTRIKVDGLEVDIVVMGGVLNASGCLAQNRIDRKVGARNRTMVGANCRIIALNSWKLYCQKTVGGLCHRTRIENECFVLGKDTREGEWSVIDLFEARNGGKDAVLGRPMSVFVKSETLAAFKRSSNGVFLGLPSEQAVVFVSAFRLQSHDYLEFPSLVHNLQTILTGRAQACTDGMWVVSKIDAPCSFASSKEESAVVSNETTSILSSMQRPRQFPLLELQQRLPDVFEDILQSLPAATVRNVAATCVDLLRCVSNREWSHPFLQSSGLEDEFLRRWEVGTVFVFSMVRRPEPACVVSSSPRSAVVPVTGLTGVTMLIAESWRLADFKRLTKVRAKHCTRNAGSDAERVEVEIHTYGYNNEEARMERQRWRTTLQQLVASELVRDCLAEYDTQVSYVTTEALETAVHNVAFQAFREKIGFLSSRLMSREHPRMLMKGTGTVIEDPRPVTANNVRFALDEAVETGRAKSTDWHDTLVRTAGFCHPIFASFSFEKFGLSLVPRNSFYLHKFSGLLDKRARKDALARLKQWLKTVPEAADVYAMAWVLSQNLKPFKRAWAVQEKSVAAFEHVVHDLITHDVSLANTQVGGKQIIACPPTCGDEPCDNCRVFVWQPEHVPAQKVTMTLFVLKFSRKCMHMYSSEVLLPNLPEADQLRKGSWRRLKLANMDMDSLWLSDGERDMVVNVPSGEIDDALNSVTSRYVCKESVEPITNCVVTLDILFPHGCLTNIHMHCFDEYEPFQTKRRLLMPLFGGNVRVVDDVPMRCILPRQVDFMTLEESQFTLRH